MASQLAALKAKREQVKDDPKKAKKDSKKKSKKQEEEEEDYTPIGSPVDSTKQFEEVKDCLKILEENTSKILKLNEKACTSSEEQKSVMKDLEDLIMSTQKQAKKTKDLMTKLEKETRELEAKSPGSTTATIRKNMLDTLNARLTQAVTKYSEAGESVRSEMKERIKRSVKNVGGKITEAQVEQAMQSPDPGIVLRQAMGLTGAALDAVAELEERHERMRAIEHGVREVLELFQDLSILVAQQQDTLDAIVVSVNSTKVKTQIGAAALADAQKTQKKSRKWQCAALVGALIVLIVIIVAASAVRK